MKVGMCKNEKGMVLVLCLFILLTLSVMGAAAINTTVTDTMISRNLRDTIQARFLADAGISHGGELLMQDLSKWDSHDTGQVLVSERHLGTGHYEVTLKPLGGGDRRRMVSKARAPGGAEARMEAVLKPCYTLRDVPGLFGCRGIDVSGLWTSRSYSSSGQPSVGDRGNVGTGLESSDLTLSGHVTLHGHGLAADRLFLKEDVQILGNGLANGLIRLQDRTTIGQDAETADRCEGCRGRVRGSIREYVPEPPAKTGLCDPLDLDGVFQEEAAPISWDNDNAELGPPCYDPGGSGFLAGGADACDLGVAGREKHYFLMLFRADSAARITLRGDVRLYVDGDFSVGEDAVLELDDGASLTLYVTGEFTCLSSAQIINRGRPQDLLIYMDYPSWDADDCRFKWHTPADLTAVVYAPRTGLEIKSDGNLFGSIRGKWVRVISNGTFWYDEDLSMLTAQPILTGFEILLKRYIN